MIKPSVVFQKNLNLRYQITGKEGEALRPSVVSYIYIINVTSPSLEHLGLPAENRPRER